MGTDLLLDERPRDLDLTLEVAMIVTPQLMRNGMSHDVRGIEHASVLRATKESSLRVWIRGHGRNKTFSSVSVSHGADDVVSVGEGGSLCELLRS